MLKYVLKRIGLMVLCLFVIVSVTFFALRLIPGGPYDDDPDLLPEAKQALEERMNLINLCWFSMPSVSWALLWTITGVLP